MANEHETVSGTQNGLLIENIQIPSFSPRVYTPLIKHKKFDPSPVAGKIPYFADGQTNPSNIGSSLYNEFWLEQVDRCNNGYVTQGTHIPGRYYWYLNFIPLAGLLGTQYPFYVDFDLEFFRLVDDIKKYKKKGMIGLKARRKGFSEKIQGGILAYGQRFTDNYRAAITAGRERYMIGLRKKLEFTNANIVDEFKIHILVNNSKNYDAGFELKNERGQYEKQGFMSQIFCETMYDNPNKLEGEFFHDVVCEESGEYEKLDEVISSIEPALEFGAQRLGTFYIYGTAGNILTSSRAFKEFYDNAEDLGFAKLWVPGTRLYFPFFGNTKQEIYVDIETGETFDAVPHLRKYQPEERIGCEDIKAAEQEILRKRRAYQLLNKRKKLKEHMQNYPLTVEEAFSTSGNNNFNSEAIVHQLMQIEGDFNLLKPYILDFVMEKQGDHLKIKMPLEVVARPAKNSDPEYNIVYIYQPPMPEMFNLDIAGFDSYNQDQTQTSDSLGSVIVVRRGNLIAKTREGIHDAEYPVALYYARPPRKEMCFEIGLKMAVYYNTIRNMMINAEQDFAIDYFIKNNGVKYLSPRPKSFDSPKSQQIHKYGAKMTGSSKPIVLGLLQTMVEDYCPYFFFPLLLRDLMGYDEVNVGEGDWDSADALALAKMRIVDMKTSPRTSEEVVAEDDEAEWTYDKRGNPVLKRNYEMDGNLQIMIKPAGNVHEEKNNWREM